MNYIAISDLRANLMKALKQVEKGTTLIITSRGKPVAKLVPTDDSVKQAQNKLKELKKTAKIHDILSPVSESWKAER